jgi:hypothetical protein
MSMPREAGKAFKLTIGNEGLYKTSNVYRIVTAVKTSNFTRVVNFAKPNIFIGNCMMLPYCNIHNYTWTYPDGKTHNQTDNILTNR